MTNFVLFKSLPMKKLPTFFGMIAGCIFPCSGMNLQSQIVDFTTLLFISAQLEKNRLIRGRSQSKRVDGDKVLKMLCAETV